MALPLVYDSLVWKIPLFNGIFPHNSSNNHNKSCFIDWVLLYNHEHKFFFFIKENCLTCKKGLTLSFASPLNNTNMFFVSCFFNDTRGYWSLKSLSFILALFEWRKIQKKKLCHCGIKKKLSKIRYMHGMVVKSNYVLAHNDVYLLGRFKRKESKEI